MFPKNFPFRDEQETAGFFFACFCGFVILAAWGYILATGPGAQVIP